MMHIINYRLLIIIFICIAFQWSCERPNSPDFRVDHTINTPLLAEEKFVFLGQSNAIIDTTSSEFDSLFSVNREPGLDSGLVSLSQEQDIDLGEMGDAIPTIESDPQFINAGLGTINGETGEDTQAEVGTFSPDFSGSGQATFQDILNQDPPPEGQTVPGGSNTVRIPLETSNFVSATIEDGSIQIVVENNLGLDISGIEIQLYSNTDGNEEAVGSSITNNTMLNHDESYTDQITFSQGEQMEIELEAEVFLEWNSQNYQGATDPALNVNASDQDLVVSQATSDIPQQSLNPTTPDIQIGDEQFNYATLTSDNPDEQLNRLDLQITNNTELPLTNANSTGTPAVTLSNSDGEVLDQQRSLQVEGQPNATQIEAGETGSVRFNLSGETITRNLSYTLDLGTAGGDNLQVNENDQVNIETSTTELEVAEARLKMDAEELETRSAMTLDNNEFQFTQPDHYVELDSGALVIDSLRNQLNVDINILQVQVDDIFTPEGDTLEISFEGSSDGPPGSYQYRLIEANETDADRGPIRIDLSGFRINALNNEIEYEVTGRTEDTGTEAVIVRSSDEVGAKMQVTELEVGEARGIIAEKEIFLSDDDPANGVDIFDIFNDQEAEVQNFDDLAELSERIGETRFFDTGFDLLYEVNLGVPARLYGILVGISEEGNRVFLSPKEGSPYRAQNSNYIEGLQINGQQADPSRVLKLPIETTDQIGDTYHGAIHFDQETSNVDAFLSNFPTTIRFIGKAVSNPQNEEGFIVTPINFNSSVGFDIPIQFANSEGSEVLKDTLDVDLGSLPGPDDSSVLKESAIRIQYENMLPLQIDLQLTFLDEENNVVTEAPLTTEDPVLLEAPEIDQQTRFANTPFNGEMVIDFTEEQAQKLHQTRKIRLGGNLVTPSGSEGSHRVKVRQDDYFQFKLIGDFKIQSDVN